MICICRAVQRCVSHAIFYVSKFTIRLTPAAKTVYSLYVKSEYVCRAVEHRVTTNDVFEITFIWTWDTSNQIYTLGWVCVCSCEAYELNIKEYTADNSAYVVFLMYYILHVSASVIVSYTYISNQYIKIPSSQYFAVWCTWLWPYSPKHVLRLYVYENKYSCDWRCIPSFSELLCPIRVLTRLFPA